MKRQIIISIYFILLITGSLEAKETGENVTSLKLKNGLNLVLIENHSSPLIASVVTVNAGSINETREINGISHMLEHLLFNGTSNRTQNQLYSEQDNYGIYINAHTDREYTNYIVLAEKEFIEKALDIQSDMLFHSIFPEEKFEKEKGIILNELARDSSSDSYWANEFFNRNFYQRTPLNLTVLGTPSSIKKIKREEVIKYYQAYYKPNNMTVLVMGDFEPEAMIGLFEKYFGSISPGKIPKPETYQLDSTIYGKTYVQKIKSKNVYLYLGTIAPSIGDKDFYAFYLFTQMFNLHLKDDLNERLKTKNGSPILGILPSFNFSKSLSTFTISALLAPHSEAETIKKEIISYLEEFIKRKFQKNETQGLLTSLNVGEKFLFEKPHYYGMMKGPWIAAGGWEFTRSYIEKLAKVSAEDLKRVGKKYFTKPKFLTIITLPGDKKPEYSDNNYYASETLNPKSEEESILLTQLWEKENSSGQKKSKIEAKKQFPKKPKLTASKITRRIKKIVLKNGLTFLINSNSDSEVFAIHLLAKNRTALEPLKKEGIADFLHRLIDRRTNTRDKKQLKDALNSIGAAFKTVDNPYIPYDDYYTSREFSSIRFETIDRFFKEAIYNFSDIVLNPSFLRVDIEDVRKEMLSLIQKENEKPSKISGYFLYEELFNKSTFFRRINGTEESIASITKEDLEGFYKYYFAPNNLIISVSTSVDNQLVLKELEKYFKGSPRVKIPDLSHKKYPVLSRGKSIQFLLNKTQSYIRLGTLFKMDKNDGEAGFRVLASILSQRLSQNLREKKGIAYSLGAKFSKHNDYGLFQIAVGTRPKTLKEAEKDIFKEIEKIRKEKILTSKLYRLINLYNSRRLMRSLSRISQCYQMGINEFKEKPFDYNEKLLYEIKKINNETLQKLAIKYLKRENMVKIIIE